MSFIIMLYSMHQFNKKIYYEIDLCKPRISGWDLKLIYFMKDKVIQAIASNVKLKSKLINELNIEYMCVVEPI